MKKKMLTGFTLIELLIVIAIIGILSGLATAALQGNLGKGRDAQRRNDLKQLQNALQAYYNDNGSYPKPWNCTPKQVGCGAWSWEFSTTDPAANSQTYIQGLAPTYIKRLPNDPTHRMNLSFPTCATANATWKYGGYGYISDGQEYKILAWCTPEGILGNQNDALYDPPRPAYDWQISTDFAYNNW